MSKGTCRDCWYMPWNGPCASPFLGDDEHNPLCFVVSDKKSGTVEEHTSCRSFTPNTMLSTQLGRGGEGAVSRDAE